MLWFAIATLLPAACLALACVYGASWPIWAIASITVLVFGMDRLIPRVSQDAAERSGLWLSIALAAVHFALWLLGLTALGMEDHLEPLDKALLIIGLGLYFGQISNSNAHELIHNPKRLPRRLGILVYASVLFAHHASAHMRVHHIHAATPQDPSTARAGEGFWRYLSRAWVGGFRAGWQAETKLRGQKNATLWSHPYLTYLALMLAFVLLSAALGGLPGVLGLLAIAAYAQVQLFLSDYVQHYGLIRTQIAPGTFAPIGPEHSWNAPHWYSASMMLNAPRHSDHHIHPARPFPALNLDARTMPTLPHSLPVMAVVALFPPVWRRVMDKRAALWRAAGQTADPAPM